MKKPLRKVVIGFIAISLGGVVISMMSPKKNITDFVNFVKEGDLISAQKCLDDGVDVNGFRQEGWPNSKSDGQTALAVAISSKSLKSVKWLIKHGADVNLQWNGTACPIIEAAVIGDLEILQELEKAGANFNVVHIKMTPSSWAERAGHNKEFISYIRKREVLNFSSD